MQAYRYSIYSLGEELKLLSDIFQGLREVEEGFDVTLTGIDTQGRHRLQLNPNPPWSQINYIRLSVDPGDYHIRVLELYDHVGSLTRFTLGDFAGQKSFEEDFFSFVVPEGVRVIEE